MSSSKYVGFQSKGGGTLYLAEKLFCVCCFCDAVAKTTNTKQFLDRSHAQAGFIDGVFHVVVVVGFIPGEVFHPIETVQVQK